MLVQKLIAKAAIELSQRRSGPAYRARARNAIERMFCRLKDFRRVATRYDRLATNFLPAVCLAPASATGCESRP